jgi:hypothetical protein
MTTPTHTPETLAALGTAVGWREISRRTGLSEALVRAMARGDRPISPASAEALEALDMDAAAGAHNEPAPSLPAEASAAAVDDPGDPETTGHPSPVDDEHASLDEARRARTTAYRRDPLTGAWGSSERRRA